MPSTRVREIEYRNCNTQDHNAAQDRPEDCESAVDRCLPLSLFDLEYVYPLLCGLQPAAQFVGLVFAALDSALQAVNPALLHVEAAEAVDLLLHIFLQALCLVVEVMAQLLGERRQLLQAPNRALEYGDFFEDRVIYIV